MAIDTTGGETAEADWIAETMRQAAALERRIADPAGLAELAAKLDAALEGLESAILVPASPTAARIIGAAKPRPNPDTNGATRAVVVEGYLATGVQIVRAARGARKDGASQVGAIAVAANPAGAAFVAAELGAPVIVLES